MFFSELPTKITGIVDMQLNKQFISGTEIAIKKDVFSNVRIFCYEQKKSVC